ncbi:MAG: hypothetical protein Q9167_006624, partial [Letrouitia subvulpina]
MSALIDICSQLGLIKGNSSHSRWFKAFYQDAKDFSKLYFWIHDVQGVAAMFLVGSGQGKRHFQGTQDYLVVPKLTWAKDESQIQSLMARLFSFIRGNATGEGFDGETNFMIDRVVNLEEPTSGILSSIETVTRKSPPRSTSELQTLIVHAPSSRVKPLVLGRVIPVLVFSAFVYFVVVSDVSSSQGPKLTSSQANINLFIAPNKVELVRLISSWSTDHNGAKPPACVKWDQKAFENCFAKEATCTNSSSSVWILRLGILDRFMCWVIENESGCQLVRQIYNKRTGFMYQPWLGANHGFATRSIARLPKLSGSLRIQSYADQKGLDAEDVLNDHAITDFDLASDQDKVQDLGETEQLDKYQSNSSSLSSLSSSSSDSDYGPASKRIRRSAKVKIYRKRGMVKKSRQVRRQAETSSNPLMVQTTLDQFIPTPRISDPRHTEVSFQGTFPTSKSTGYPTTSDITSQTYPNPTYNASGFCTPFSPPNVVKNITFHFFLANESLGAITKTMGFSVTRTDFFKEAIRAFHFGAKSKACGRVIAASVSVEGGARPVVVPRASEEAFGHMVGVVREVASASSAGTGTGRVDVE